MKTSFRFSVLAVAIAVSVSLAACKEDVSCETTSALEPIPVGTLSVETTTDASAPDAADAGDAGGDAASDHAGDPAYDVQAACSALKCVAPQRCLITSATPGAIAVSCGIGPC